MDYYFIYFVVFKSKSYNPNEPIVVYADSEAVRKDSNGTMKEI